MSRRTQIILKREACNFVKEGRKKFRPTEKKGRGWYFVIKWADGTKFKSKRHWMNRSDAQRKADNVVKAREENERQG